MSVVQGVVDFLQANGIEGTIVLGGVTFQYMSLVFGIIVGFVIGIILG